MHADPDDRHVASAAGEPGGLKLPLAAQLTAFMEDVLPSIAARDPGVFDVPAEPTARSVVREVHSVDAWRAAAARLCTAVRTQLTAAPQRIDREDFRHFTHSEPAIDYSVEGGRIRWKITSYCDVDWRSAAELMFRQAYGWPPLDDSHPAHSIEAVQRHLLAGATDDVWYYNEYIAMLPAPADDEPEFVKMMLDPAAWRQRIESNRTLSDAQRQVQLQKLTAPRPGGYFQLVIHNALVHVISALANNRFDEIRPYIDHSEFPGRYSDLVPRYLFANLLAKVQTIQEHCPHALRHDR